MLKITIDYIFVWALCLVTLCSAGRVKRIVGGHQAKAPPPDDPVVFSRIFGRDARVEGFRNNRTGIYTFLALYYAEPPLGMNRYARPIYKRLAGDVNATKHGPPCIQPDSYNPSRIVGDENCLFLNVYTPRMPDESTGLPVIVWIHPGGFRFGSANQYDATPIAEKNVIVVAPQYRLGSLGIMGDGTKEFDGNLALFDMAAALRWVNDYIAYFGGDPKKVQAMGHGSGAASAMYLSTSRTARSAADVNGVVAMSGSALSQYATDKEPVQSVQEVAKINGCPTTNELEIVKCLRQKPAEEIIKNDEKIQTERLAGRAMIKGMTGGMGFNPHVEYENDNRALPSLIEYPAEKQLKSGDFVPIPLLTGVSKHETGNAFKLDSIEQIFGSAESFLHSLTDSLKDLTSFLRIDQLTGQIAKPQLPGLSSTLTPSLQDVLKIPTNLKINEIFNKMVESTTDVLFNLPAVLTTQQWSKIAPAFMYNFDYAGTTSKGINFLRGLPIVSGLNDVNNSISLVGHGDELGYMFDCNDIFGNPLPQTQLSDANDLKVRHNMLDMIVHFVDSIHNESKTQSLFSNVFQTVTDKTLPFINVGMNLEASKDFRFCELSVLGANLNPLSSISCKGLGNLLSSLTNSFNNVTNLSGLKDNLDTKNLGGLLNTGGTPLSRGRITGLGSTSRLGGGLFNSPSLTDALDGTGFNILGR